MSDVLLTSNDYRFNSVLIYTNSITNIEKKNYAPNDIPLKSWCNRPSDSNTSNNNNCTRKFALIIAIWKIYLVNEEPHTKQTQTSCVTFWVTGCNATSHLFVSSSPLRLCTFVVYLHKSIGRIYFFAKLIGNMNILSKFKWFSIQILCDFIKSLWISNKKPISSRQSEDVVYCRIHHQQSATDVPHRNWCSDSGNVAIPWETFNSVALGALPWKQV